MDMSVMALVRRTFPFIVARLVIYGLFLAAELVFLAIMTGIGFLIFNMFGESGGAFFAVILLSFIVVYSGLRFLERYVLYLVKMSHVAVITELLRTGEIPHSKNMVSYGKQQVTDSFGASNVAFLVDSMVHGAVKQIQRWIMRAGNLFSFIPGSKNIIGILNMIMSMSLNYIDEAVMSYVFVRKSKGHEETVWKSAADGVTMYAQSWKSILKSATAAVAFIYIFSILVFIGFVVPFVFIANLIAADTPGLGTFLGFIAVVFAAIFTTILKRVLFDPIITIMMIRSYQMSIRNLEPAVDLQQKLVSVSPRFQRLFTKAEEEEKNPTPIPTEEMVTRG